MPRIAFCRNLCIAAEQISESNHHLFELEDDLELLPHHMTFIVSRNAKALSQTVYKYHDLRPTAKLFSTGVNIVNMANHAIRVKKHTLLKTLLRMSGVKYSYHVIPCRDICRAEISSKKHCTSFLHLYR